MAGQDRSNQYLRNTRTNAGDALLSSTYDGDYLARGYAFALEGNFAIATGTTLYMLIDYTTYDDFSFANVDNIRTARNGVVFIMPPRMATTDGPVQVNVYRGTNYTGGTATLYSKRNTISDIDPQITITTGATGDDKGILALSYLVGRSTTNQSSGGDTASGSVPFIRSNEGVTLVEIVNESGVDIIFSYGQTFYEI